MKKVFKPVLYSLLVLILSTACSKEVFTQSLRSRIEQKQASDLERLQYYNDIPIVLTYSSSTKDNSIKAGKVEFVDGIYRYFVQIPKMTPCVAKSYNEDVLKVYFEDGETTYLLFEKNNRTGESQRRDTKGRYQLAIAREKDGTFVRFEGKKWRVVEGEDAVLLIDKSLRFEDDTNKRTLKGVRVE
ncbi:MAG: hypothetical protein ACPF9D_04240 [Owenweeksia sp.]